MYVGNLENQGLVRLIQHLGIDAMQRAEILSQADGAGDATSAAGAHRNDATSDSTIASGRKLVFRQLTKASTRWLRVSLEHDLETCVCACIVGNDLCWFGTPKL